MTYSELQYGSKDKPLVWLHGKLKTPLFSAEARLQAGLSYQVPAKERAAVDALFKAYAFYRASLPWIAG